MSNGAQTYVMGNLSNVKLITCDLTTSLLLSIYFLLSWYSSFRACFAITLCVGADMDPEDTFVSRGVF